MEPTSSVIQFCKRLQWAHSAQSRALLATSGALRWANQDELRAVVSFILCGIAAALNVAGRDFGALHVICGYQTVLPIWNVERHARSAEPQNWQTSARPFITLAHDRTGTRAEARADGEANGHGGGWRFHWYRALARLRGCHPGGWAG